MTQSDIIRSHALRYPAMRPIDAIKLVWQSEYGAGHLVSDLETAKKRLDDEISSLCGTSLSPAVEEIGGGYVRLDLNSLDIPAECLVRMFAMPPERQGDEASFKERLALLRMLASEGIFAFDAEELEEAIAIFKPIPSHSAEYRELYRPAYRVIDRRFVALLPVIRDVAARSGRVSIAIDGRAAAGKSTAGSLLSRALGSPLFHADDYFLPPALRTPERLAEPGGNIDYARLKSEIVDRLGTDIEYTPYDCSVQSLGSTCRAHASPINILEGSYSQHPEFGDAWDVRIFCTLPAEIQQKRILARNGEGMLKRFVNEWIPMEEAYFAAFNIEGKCDYLLDNSGDEC